ncbi:hypothetical protein HMPREF9413_1279 [Paenibacillus sp. HGF7]|nr:hypothetical protein HMPREF9413_1279 [Paenibacillus sp. HGF7]
MIRRKSAHKADSSLHGPSGSDCLKQLPRPNEDHSGKRRLQDQNQFQTGSSVLILRLPDTLRRKQQVSRQKKAGLPTG